MITVLIGAVLSFVFIFAFCVCMANFLVDIMPVTFIDDEGDQ